MRFSPNRGAFVRIEKIEQRLVGWAQPEIATTTAVVARGVYSSVERPSQIELFAVCGMP